MRVGAFYGCGKCEFTVWAPQRESVALLLKESDHQSYGMERSEEGYWRVTIKGIAPNQRYSYLLDNSLERPDPASHFQPDGVHGVSAVVDHGAFAWHDDEWRGICFEEAVLYELHIGVFTREGTFSMAVSRLDDLEDLGINAVELMPVAQFVGGRNWGYDGVFPFAVQDSYGGPKGMKCFVDECHRKEIAVFLDLVFNHLGLEGNYLRDFGPYLKEKRATQWGPAVNFDGHSSSHVRSYFLQCALHWLENYHLDGFRLDAVHAIIDSSPKHFVQELAETVDAYSRRVGRKTCVIAESDINDAKLVRSWSSGGYGLCAQWLDDFHHALHALLTHERTRYYADFGGLDDMLKAFSEGFVYSGQFSSFRGKDHGIPSTDISPIKFVAFSQNHDQVGNRRLGERLITLTGSEAARLAAAVVVLSPYVPLLFMAEEYGEKSPFLYFTSYEDANLARGIREGREKEFPEFRSQGEFPDPQDPRTFDHSKLEWIRRFSGEGKRMLDYYKLLIRLRRTIPALSGKDRRQMRFSVSEQGLLFVERVKGASKAVMIANFSEDGRIFRFPSKGGDFQKVLDSADEKWNGKGSRILDKVCFGVEQVINGSSVVVFELMSESVKC